MAAATYHCPCCGYRGLSEPAYSDIPDPPFGGLGPPPYIGRFGYATFNCCDCCGFEYGFDDDAGASGQATSFRDYLVKFAVGGCQWFCPARRPDDWSLSVQLKQAGLPQLGDA